MDGISKSIEATKLNDDEEKRSSIAEEGKKTKVKKFTKTPEECRVQLSVEVAACNDALRRDSMQSIVTSFQSLKVVCDEIVEQSHITKLQDEFEWIHESFDEGVLPCLFRFVTRFTVRQEVEEMRHLKLVLELLSSIMGQEDPEDAFANHVGSYFGLITLLLRTGNLFCHDEDFTEAVCEGLLYLMTLQAMTQGENDDDNNTLMFNNNNMPQIMDILVAAHNSNNPKVKFAVIGVWPDYVELDDLSYDGEEEDEDTPLPFFKRWLIPNLPRILPIVLDCMVYTDKDFESMNNIQAQLSLKRTKKNAKRIMLKSIKEMQEKQKEDHVVPKADAEKDDDDEDDDEDCYETEDEDEDHLEDESDSDEDEDSDDEDDMSSYTLRKAAASALDSISEALMEDDPNQTVLSCVMPLLQQRMISNDWKVKESAILAFGAIAVGCLEGLSNHLPQILDLLLRQYIRNGSPNQSQSLMRAMSCWTTSRYSEFIVEHHNAAVMMPVVIMGFLEAVADSNKHVRYAACSALSVFIEAAGSEKIVPFLDGGILPVVITALNNYEFENMRILFDVIATLFETIESVEGRSKLNLLLAPIFAKFQNTAVDDDTFYTLHEVLVAIFSAMGAEAGKERYCFAMQKSIQVLQRAIRICNGEEDSKENLQKQNQAQPQALSSGAAADAEEEIISHGKVNGSATGLNLRHLEYSLDLLSSIVDGLGGKNQVNGTVPDILLANGLNFIDSLCDFIMLFLPNYNKPKHRDVRQSALALLGDCCKHCFLLFQLKQDKLIAMFPLVMECLKFDETQPPSICNNAAWIFGEIAMVSPPGFLAPYAVPISIECLKIIHGGESASHLEASATAGGALGRLCVNCPDQIIAAGTINFDTGVFKPFYPGQLSDSIFNQMFLPLCCVWTELPCDDREKFSGLKGFLQCLLRVGIPLCVNDHEHKPSCLLLLIATINRTIDDDHDEEGSSNNAASFVDDMQPLFAEIVSALKSNLAPQVWNAAWNVLPPEAQLMMSELYLQQA